MNKETRLLKYKHTRCGLFREVFIQSSVAFMSKFLDNHVLTVYPVVFVPSEKEFHLCILYSIRILFLTFNPVKMIGNIEVKFKPINFTLTGK